MTDKLNLIPDPQDMHVWENLRRIQEWAAQQEASQTAPVDYWRVFLMMGT